ncbi:hypothetical protein RM863_09865 [Streptomyces sp. DSM 41014]|uniref:Integral membrane protein n=1 Tax=Streptomyces hintoniae TaxID=3075521 RepID=A0ABU2UGP6_9ACTN|nr:MULTISPECIES: hypothetical protein [unclassified Streptomyces]MDH6697771.1 hypothetical protein [Streptomyces sp. MAA16]MDT0472433.1 hypothetical protein [Streptomyces sp. DSM 41014]
MRTRVRGWRWRQNPLRRHSDVVEAWTALLVAVLLCLGAPLAGVLAGWWAHDYAYTVAAAQRARLHEVRAEVVGLDAATQPGVGAGDGSAYRATVRWTEPHSGRHTTTAPVPPQSRQGSVVEIWLDSRGRAVPAPPGDTAVWQHAVTMGACAAGGTAGAVLLGNAVVRRTATRHRMAEWERDWARTEPEWRPRRL